MLKSELKVPAKFLASIAYMKASRSFLFLQRFIQQPAISNFVPPTQQHYKQYIASLGAIGCLETFKRYVYGGVWKNKY
jgi:hypothetical protein